MKLMKKGFVFFMLAVMLVTVCACGCSKDETSKLIESDLTGAEILDEFWSIDLAASAEKLDGYRAQTVDEVLSNWRQAKTQGNGAILYALYSTDLKEAYLDRMIMNGSWNFYYNNEAERPYQVFTSAAEAVADTDMYYSTVTSIFNDGTSNSYDIYIQLIDGGYFVVGEQAPDTGDEFIQ